MRNDLLYALRSLQKHTGFTILAVVTIALGIGANTAIFSVVNGVLLKPLPFPDADRLVRVFTSTADAARNAHSAGDFRDLRADQQSLEAIAGYRSLVFSTASGGGSTIQLTGAYVTSEFFDVLGVKAANGRAFSGPADAPSGERKVVLSDSAWRRLFQDGAEAAGASIRVDGEAHTVIGVMPPLVAWPLGAEIWILSQKDVPPSPVTIAGASAEREVRYFDAIARIRPGVTLEQAQQDLVRVARLIQQRNSATAERREIAIVGLRQEIVGDVEPVLLVLQVAVGMVLLIACANVSGLLMARAAARRRELAVRAALGASRARLIRQLLVESLLLSAVGGLVGLLVGAWLVGLLTGLLPRNVPRVEGIVLDRVVALVTMAASLVTGLLFGILPALQASRADTHAALKSAGSHGGTAARRPARSILVVAEIALTLVLLSGAGLLMHSLVKLQRVETGLAADQVTVTGLLLPQWRYQTRAAQLDVFRRLLETLGRSGQVQAVGIGFPGPLRGDNASGAFTVEGYSGATPTDRPFANLSAVSGGFFNAMGIPLVTGRTFTDRDGADAPPVAIVSTTMARKYWPGQDPLGRRLRFDDDGNPAWTTVVGVVGDVRQLGLHQDPPPILYMPYEQFVLPFTSIAVRSSAPTSAVASELRSALAAIDSSLTPGPTRPLQDLLDASLAQPRFRTTLLTGFALVALVLAAVGIYGVIGASVSQRTREIGIRVALGARPRQVLAQIMREGLLLTVVGVGLGLVGGLGAAQLIAAFLFGVDAADPLTFAAVAAILIGVAVVATYVPSRRALRVDPLTALKTD